MKLRIEGTEKEITEFIQKNNSENVFGLSPWKFKVISKFYPNRNTAQRMLNQKSETGRVYIELE